MYKIRLIERAKVKDVPAIHKLVNSFADNGEMLPRALSEIYESLRDFVIVRGDDEIVGCAALHVSWDDLAEIKALAVSPKSQNQGIGASLVQACLKDAKELGIPSVFCLTYKPQFFEKLGFHQIEKMDLPRKVWNECFRCAKFPNCDEVALVYHEGQA